MVSANDPNALVPSLKQAADAASRSSATTRTRPPTPRTVFVNQATAEDLGRVEVQVLAKQIGNKGEIAILSASTTATNQNTWIDFMKDELTKPEYKDMKLVKVAYGNDDDAKSLTETQGLMQAYPNLKGIISPDHRRHRRGGARGPVGRQVRARSPSPVSERPTRCASTSRTAPSRSSCSGTRAEARLPRLPAAAAVIQGKITGKQGETFTAGELGSYTVGEKGEILLGKPTCFNKDNIDQFDF